jgi:hypothetical protein
VEDGKTMLLPENEKAVRKREIKRDREKERKADSLR